MLDEPFSSELLGRLGLALAIGLLVGVERGWRSREAAEGGRTAGLRTFALVGLLGGVSALLSQELGGWAFAAIGIPFAGAFMLFKQREQEEEGDYSVTAVVAALLVYSLGALAVVGDWRAAAASGVVMTGLLALKGVLHTWLQRLLWLELRSALILLAMTFVALPLLPDRSFGPFGSVNFRELWLLTIAMTAISFLAYTAMKVLGAGRGMVVASSVGALVSSTAVTVQLARMSRTASSAVPFVSAALLAGAVMAGRMLIISAALSPKLFEAVLIPLGVFAGTSLVSAWRAWTRHGERAASEITSPLQSPFDLWLVLKFALLLGVVMAAARIAAGLYGSASLLPVAAIAGLADVDAVTLTAARMASAGTDVAIASYAVLIAAAADSLSKATLAAVAGGGRFAWRYAAGTAVAASVAGAAMYVSAWF